MHQHLRLLLFVFLGFAASPDAGADGVTLLHDLPDPGGSNLGGFGQSVAIDGATMVIGAPRESSGGVQTGLAYVFDVATGGLLWTLAASDGADRDFFGQSVAIFGSLIVVGAPGDDDLGNLSGSAFLFDAATGAQLMKLHPSAALGFERFGESVSLDGNHVVVGAPTATELNMTTGAAFVFDVSSGALLHRLVASDAGHSDYFGASVAVGGGAVLVGAYGWEGAGTSENQGSAYVFGASNGQELRQLVANDGGNSDQFGWAVAMDGGMALVGAPGFDRGTGGPGGGAYIFDVASGAQTRQLLPLNSMVASRCGRGVALDAGRALVASGDRYAFVHDASSGEQLASLAKWGGGGGTVLGAAALDGSRALVGAPGFGGPGWSSRLFSLLPTEDGFEDNDSCAATAPMAAGRYSSLTITPPSVLDGSDADLDYYAGTLQPGFELQVAIDFDPTVHDLDLYLHDSAQGCAGVPVQVSQTSTFNAGQESVTWHNDGSLALDYVIEVRFPSGYTGSQVCNAYSLALDQVGVPTSYCTSTINGSGVAATLGWSGSTSVAANDLVLTASGCPANQFGLYIYSGAQQQVPLGDGFLCIGGSSSLVRLNAAIMVDGGGQADLAVDLGTPPFNGGPGRIEPGSTWSFQFWFRDSGGIAGFNLSDGLRVPFGS